jgi:cytoskeletal protein RodZ
MALSMDEQRMLAEIERRLVAEDPRLAARLSSFRRPSPLITLRTPRGRIIGSLITVGLVTVISVIVYVMVPFRAHIPKSTTSPQASTSAITGARIGPPVTAAKASTPASATASHATSPSASAGTSGMPASRTKTGTRTSPAASQPAPVNAS